MTGDDLSREQFDTLASQLRLILREVNALHKRADRGLDPGDVLLDRIRQAADHVHRLWVHVHYRSANVQGKVTRHLPPGAAIPGA